MQDKYIWNVLKKDPNAGMNLLLEQYAGVVHAVVRGRLLTPPFTAEDVDDCVSEVFLQFYQGLSRYDPAKGSLKAWLCVIARNQAVDRVRRRYGAPAVVPLEEAAGQPGQVSPEEELARQEEREELLRAIRALEEPDREIIFRKYCFLQTSKEIARRLGMSVSAVDTRAHRALEKLRKQWR